MVVTNKARRNKNAQLSKKRAVEAKKYISFILLIPVKNDGTVFYTVKKRFEMVENGRKWLKTVEND